MLACELVVEVDHQRVVPPVKGGQQMKETEEADLRRTEEEGEICSHDLLSEQREAKKKKKPTNKTGAKDIILKVRGINLPGRRKGCRLQEK